MASGSGTDYIEMDLGNVADGELEQQFKEELMKVMDVKAALGLYKETGGVVGCSISATITFGFHVETGALLIETSANFKPPKRRTVARAAFIQNGQMLVEDAVQQPLIDNVTPIDKEKNGE